MLLLRCDCHSCSCCSLRLLLDFLGLCCGIQQCWRKPSGFTRTPQTNWQLRHWAMCVSLPLAVILLASALPPPNECRGASVSPPFLLCLVCVCVRVCVYFGFLIAFATARLCESLVQTRATKHCSSLADVSSVSALSSRRFVFALPQHLHTLQHH